VGFQKWKKSEESQLAVFPNKCELFIMYKWNDHFENNWIIGKEMVKSHCCLRKINVYGDQRSVEAFIF
jgi:hypothetical protein